MLKIRGSTGGMALVEFVFTFPMFIFFLITGFETLRLSYNYLAVQLVANQAVRLVQQCPCTASGCTSDPNRAMNIKNKLQSFGGGLGVQGANVCIAPQSAANTCTGPNWTANTSLVGKPRDSFLIRVQRNITLAFGLKTVSVDALAIGRHEPPESAATANTNPACI